MVEKKEIKVKTSKRSSVTATDLLKFTQFGLLPFDFLTKKDFNSLKAGESIEIDSDLLKTHSKYFIEVTENGSD